MWYIAEVLFAQPQTSERKMYMCETSEVLLSAESANHAYEKALDWGRDYEEHSFIQIKMVGVTRLISIDEERPGDGTEIAGSMFRMKEVWKRKDQVIPRKSNLSAVLWEQNSDVPVKELLEEKRGKDFVYRIENLK